MFNFKTKMIENKKTEKWSSLRLDLQQFTPQEFVATCWQWDLVCTHEDANLYHTGNGNNPYSHGTTHSVTLTAADDNEKLAKTQSVHFVNGRYGPKQNNTTDAVLWYFQSTTNGYHIYGGEEWYETNHS